MGLFSIDSHLVIASNFLIAKVVALNLFASLSTVLEYGTRSYTSETTYGSRKHQRYSYQSFLLLKVNAKSKRKLIAFAIAH